MKKSFVLLSLLLFNFYSTNIYAAELDTPNMITTEFTNEYGHSVDLTLNEDIIDNISNDEILDIINTAKDGEKITIYDVVETLENSHEQEFNSNSRLIGVTTYKTEKTYSSKNVYAKDHFITSAAKGHTKTLTSSITKTSTLSISGSYYDYAKLNLDKSKTYTASTTDTFQGPPESSQYNSRSFYAREYVNKGSYKQYQCFNNFCSGAKSGTFNEPAKFVLYAKDEKY